MWKQLLKLRDLAKIFLSCDLGNGKSCSFWHDTWTPFGDLLSFLGPNAHQILGLPLDAKVVNARSEFGWIFRGARNHKIEQLLSHLVSIDTKDNEEDKYLWLAASGEPRNRFIFSDTWSLIRNHGEKIPWHNQVWFSGSIPKHSFIMWLACLDRLPTLTRMRSWGIVEDDTCYLCEIYAESRDHLFLRCPYSYDIWRWCLAKLQYRFTGFETWSGLLTWLRSPATENSLMELRLVAAQTVLYSIWRERNARIFSAARTPAESLLPAIDKGIRNTCSARKHLPKFNMALQLWFRDSISF